MYDLTTPLEVGDTFALIQSFPSTSPLFELDQKNIVIVWPESILPSVVDPNSSNDMKTDSVWIVSLETDVNNYKDLKAKIYPNPTSELLFVELSGLAKQEVQSIGIYNMYGQQLMQKDASNFLEISTVNLPNGIYSLQLNGKDGEILKQSKFLVLH